MSQWSHLTYYRPWQPSQSPPYDDTKSYEYLRNELSLVRLETSVHVISQKQTGSIKASIDAANLTNNEVVTKNYG